MTLSPPAPSEVTRINPRPPKRRLAQQQRDALTPERAAREHAERWYAALRGLHAVDVRAERLDMGYGGAGGGREVYTTASAFSRGQKGYGFAISATHAVLKTPLGALDFHHVRAAFDALEARPEPGVRPELLMRVRAGECVETLAHPNGGWINANARAYAVAVLALAERLGDRAAPRHLKTLREAP